MKSTPLSAVTIAGAVSTLLVAAGTAWAHDDFRRGSEERFEHHERFEHRHEHYYRPVVIQQPVYGYAPQPVYYAAPPAYVAAPVHVQPAPVYYKQPTYYEAPRVSNAAIGNTVGRGNGRTAAIAIGAVTGAMIGGKIAR